MKANDVERLAVILLILAAILVFLYTDPIGIKIGYRISGGEKTAELTENEQALLRDYKEYVMTYKTYRDSDNPTCRSWAETAKQKANAMADEYGRIGKYVLEKIGE